MERAGEKLKRARDRLKLTYRDVEEASQTIAARHGSDEFAIALSRLADIENKGTVPTIFRIYSLSAIYRLDFDEVLRWYGVPRDELAADAANIGLNSTHLVHFTPGPIPSRPASAAPVRNFEIDLNQTTFLNHLARHWGKGALGFLDVLDLPRYRYGFIGLEDWSMYPILRPGSLVAIDESRRKIASAGWSTEFDRPIYFLEHRGGNICAWCSLENGRLWIQPHPGSQQPARSFSWPEEVDLIGQVVGVAMVLDAKSRHGRILTGPAKSQNP